MPQTPESPVSAEAQIDAFLAKYTPAMEAQLRAARHRLRALALIAQACRPIEARLQVAPPLTTVIKTVAATQRARRPLGQ